MSSSSLATENQYQLACPQLPLAVYREVAAHLRQIEGVDAGLISRPYSSPDEKFDYNQSQIKALWIKHNRTLNDRHKQLLTEILDYYAKKYQPWVEVV